MVATHWYLSAAHLRRRQSLANSRLLWGVACCWTKGVLHVAAGVD